MKRNRGHVRNSRCRRQDPLGMCCIGFWFSPDRAGQRICAWSESSEWIFETEQTITSSLLFAFVYLVIYLEDLFLILTFILATGYAQACWEAYFICSHVGRHSDYFQFLAIVNKTAINVLAHILSLMHALISLGYMFRSVIAGPESSEMCKKIMHPNFIHISHL